MKAKGINGNGCGTPLAMAVKLWSTPQTFDANDINRSAEALARAKEKGGCSNLREIVKVFATPTASPWRSGHVSTETHDCNSRPLNEQIVTLEGTGTETPPTGSLNPAWVEWLMGFPLGWTDLEDSATP